MAYEYIKQKQILIVDDEQELLKMEQMILSENGFHNILEASCIKEVKMLVQTQKPELFILDVMLPDGSGFELGSYLKSISDAPIIFLTAKGEDEDRISGLGIGADDYIIKPFLPQEFILRINAVLRRCYQNEGSIIELEHSIIDFNKAEVIKGKDIFKLTAKEYTILHALSLNPNCLLTIDALCNATWGDDSYGYENSLMAHIRRIREKIELTPSSPSSLVTIKGLGYKLIVKSRR